MFQIAGVIEKLRASINRERRSYVPLGAEGVGPDFYENSLLGKALGKQMEPSLTLSSTRAALCRTSSSRGETVVVKRCATFASLSRTRRRAVARHALLT